MRKGTQLLIRLEPRVYKALARAKQRSGVSMKDIVQLALESMFPVMTEVLEAVNAAREAKRAGQMPLEWKGRMPLEWKE